MSNHISKTSKLGCFSWSLEALKTCPGSLNSNGELVDSCKICYATCGNYRFSNVKKVRQENKEAWKSEYWVPVMTEFLKTESKFRFFDSGDGYSVDLWKKMYEIIKLSPQCKFWIPTKMYKFESFREIIDKINDLPNAIVRFSSDSIKGEYTEGIHGSTVIPTQDFDTNAFVCKSYENEGKCLNCDACWNKEVSVIAYVAHGQKAKKILKTL